MRHIWKKFCCYLGKKLVKYAKIRFPSRKLNINAPESTESPNTLFINIRNLIKKATPEKVPPLKLRLSKKNEKIGIIFL